MTCAQPLPSDRLAGLDQLAADYLSTQHLPLIPAALALIAAGGWHRFDDGMVRFPDGGETRLTFAVDTPNGCSCAAGTPGPCVHELAVRCLAIGRLPLPPAGPRRPIYLDHHATTPLAPEVAAEMRPFFAEQFGNAASDHRFGIDAAAAVRVARERVAALLNVSAADVIFTSGATEANNLALFGVAEHAATRGRHIISAVTEHAAVLSTLRQLQQCGWNVTLLPVDADGLVDPDAVARAIRRDTALVSIMAANNEIGTLAPLAAIGAVCAERGVLFHTDAAQACGHVPLDLPALGVDLLSLSGHKLSGPKGIGALIVRQRWPRIKLAPRQLGGSQERGLRAGTLDVPSIVGLGAAAAYAAAHLDLERVRVGALRDDLWRGLAAALPGMQLNGHPTERLAHSLSVRFPGIDQRALLAQLAPDLAVSTGSACHADAVEPSHVLLAIDPDPRRAFETMRFGLGRTTTPAEIAVAVEVVVAAVQRLQALTAHP